MSSRLPGIAVLVALAAATAALWGFQRFGIYRFDRTAQVPDPAVLHGVRPVAFPAGDGTEARAWIKPPAEGQPVLVSFFGNFTAIGASAERLAPLLDRGWGLAMLEYRGSGTAPGRPSEAGFARDARALYDRLEALLGVAVPPGRRVIHGFSLGSGVAVRLAAERPAALLAVESGFARLCDYFEARLRGLPLCRLMWRERYASVRRIGDAAMPVFQAHGGRDGAVPVASARALHAAAPPGAELKIYPGAGHADLAAHGFLDDLAAAYSAAAAQGGA